MPRPLARRLYLLPAVLAAGAFGATAAGAVGSATAGPAAKKIVPEDGRYKGFVGPDTIRFTVTSDGKKISHLVTTYNPAADCSIPTADQTESFGTLEIHDGSFKGSEMDARVKEKPLRFRHFVVGGCLVRLVVGGAGRRVRGQRRLSL